MGTQRAVSAVFWMKPALAGRLLLEGCSGDHGRLELWSLSAGKMSTSQREVTYPGPAGPSEGPPCCQSCHLCDRGNTEEGCSHCLPEGVTGEKMALWGSPRTCGEALCLRRSAYGPSTIGKEDCGPAGADGVAWVLIRMVLFYSGSYLLTQGSPCLG